jgi:wyosine [tRNA(Phe)-imidazoG37] synthetase (radical SAM superfamily)
MSNYVFGPFPSRRLGRSLGVDLVPWKTCTYDCIYCQLGGTTRKTLQRKECVPRERVLQELQERLQTRPDYGTLSGSGEPVLCAKLDTLLRGIRQPTEIPIAVLTNGSLLLETDLQRELCLADLVIPSLDAGNEATFRRVNHPHPGPATTFNNCAGKRDQVSHRRLNRVANEHFALLEPAEILVTSNTADRPSGDPGRCWLTD